MLRERQVEVPRETDRMKIMVVGDVRLYREGIAASLAHRDGFTVVCTATSCADAASRLAACGPDIVILDMTARGSLDFVRDVVSSTSGVRIIAFAVEETKRDILLCAEAGAAGFVPCDGTIEDLVATIRSVARGELRCSPRIAATLFRALHVEPAGPDGDRLALTLTAREREVAPLLDRGLSNKEIAAQLHIEVATVKNHVHNLLEKLHVASRAEAGARLRPGRTAPPSRLRPDDLGRSGERTT